VVSAPRHNHRGPCSRCSNTPKKSRPRPRSGACPKPSAGRWLPNANGQTGARASPSTRGDGPPSLYHPTAQPTNHSGSTWPNLPRKPACKLPPGSHPLTHDPNRPDFPSIGKLKREFDIVFSATQSRTAHSDSQIGTALPSMLKTLGPLHDYVMWLQSKFRDYRAAEPSGCVFPAISWRAVSLGGTFDQMMPNINEPDQFWSSPPLEIAEASHLAFGKTVRSDFGWWLAIRSACSALHHRTFISTGRPVTPQLPNEFQPGSPTKTLCSDRSRWASVFK